MSRTAERRRRQRRASHAGRPAATTRALGATASREAAQSTVLWWTAVVTLFAAQYLHWRVAGPHADEWAPSGVFFAVLVVAEGATAAVFAVTRGRRGAAAAVGVSVLAASVWAMDRSLGLPFGPDPWTRGPVGRADMIATVLEVLTALSAAGFVSCGRRPARRRVPESGSLTPTSRRAIVGLGSLAVVYAVGLYAFAVSAPMGERAG